MRINQRLALMFVVVGVLQIIVALVVRVDWLWPWYKTAALSVAVALLIVSAILFMQRATPKLH